MNKNKILSVIYEKDSEKVYIHANKNGLKELIESLKKLEEGCGNEDIILMTPKWGGEELTEEEPGNDGDIKINWLKVYKWDSQKE